ncbi:MAG: GFA family protein [Alphaproteobacteria bacterium]
MPLPKPPFTGGCQCGACRYRVTGAPHWLYACHCTECRAQSAAAFGISLIVAVDDFALSSGVPRVWERPTASAGRLACSFCPECGTRLFHQRSIRAQVLSIKGGSLDHGPDLSEAYHIWTASKLPGVVIPPGATCYAQEPPD